jgi:hypothetical protein
MPKCCCDHNESEHATFGNARPCVNGDCMCEDFNFGGDDRSDSARRFDAALKGEALAHIARARRPASPPPYVELSIDPRQLPLPLPSHCPPAGDCREYLYPACPDRKVKQ